HFANVRIGPLVIHCSGCHRFFPVIAVITELIGKFAERVAANSFRVQRIWKQILTNLGATWHLHAIAPTKKVGSTGATRRRRERCPCPAKRLRACAEPSWLFGGLSARASRIPTGPSCTICAVPGQNGTPNTKR